MCKWRIGDSAGNRAEVVKQIFDLYLAGNTFAQIKRALEKAEDNDGNRKAGMTRPFGFDKVQ